MSRTIHLDTLQAEQVAFSYSPLHETVQSLRVLTKSKQHPLHLPWIMRMRQHMPAQLKAEVSAFGILFGGKISDIFGKDLQRLPDFPTFEEEFRLVQTLSPQDYATLIITQSILPQEATSEPHPSFERVLLSSDIQQHILTRTAELHPASLPMVQELFTDPQQSQRRFLSFLSNYWETCLAPEWPQLETSLLRDIEQRGQILFQQGPAALLRSLAPQLQVHQEEETVTLQYPSKSTLEMRIADTLFLMPSTYVWPRLLFMEQDDEVLTAIVYSIQSFQEEGNVPVPPERLLKLLRAAGDMTRLQILQLLSQRPRSTQELAGVLGLSEAGISKQVKLLQDAGFLKSERSSYYVLYRSVRDPLAELTRGLDQVLTSSPPEFL